MEPTTINPIPLPTEKKKLPQAYFDLKSRIHHRLLDMVDLSIMENMEKNILKAHIRQVVEKILHEESGNLPLNLSEREKIFSEVLDEVLGLGPLETLLKDPTVSDILVNTYNRVYVERFGKIEPTDIRFKE